MENYFSFNRKIILSFGINIESEGENFVQLFLKFITTLGLILGVVQAAVFFFTWKELDFFFSSSATTSLFFLQSFVKYILTIKHIKQLISIKNELEAMTMALSALQKKKHQKLFESFRKITKIISLASIISLSIFCVLPLVRMIVQFSSTGSFNKSFIFSYAYPFDRTGSEFFGVYIYEIYSAYLLSSVSPVLDQFYLLMIGQIVVQFKCLEDDLLRVINEGGTSSLLNNFVTKHQKILDLSESLQSIFNWSLVVHFASALGTIIFIGLIVAVQQKLTKKCVKFNH